MQREETHPRAPFPLPARLLGIPGVQPLELQVADVSDIGSRMRRIRLTSVALADFTYKAGQDVMLVLGGTPERPLNRRYSIRDVDRQTRTLELNIVTHGIHGPGAQWAASARAGDRVNGVGPRGKVFLDPDADWHLLLGDESAAPASLNMLEAVPGSIPGLAYLEVASPDDELPTNATGVHEVRWLHRGDTPATASALLVEAMRSAALPTGRGHVYIAGEVQVVAEVQRAALARGLVPEQVFAKAFWGRGRANADRGEPD
ncbi:MAG: siderophore-interacting protein [Chloroflexota bacterium]|nr:siderophore-interacting protein [Chloroflexota bacterium]